MGVINCLIRSSRPIILSLEGKLNNFIKVLSQIKKKSFRKYLTNEKSMLYL